MDIKAMMAEKLEQNPFKSLTDVIYEILLEKIVSYEYKPGSRIPVSALADTLHVSKTPVKEAVAMLEKDGFVSASKNKGAYISPFDYPDFLNFLRLRTTLETNAIVLAAERIQAAELDQIKKYLDELYHAYAQASYPLIFSSEQNFHAYIIACSKNRYFIDAYADIEIYLRRFRIYIAIAKENYEKYNLYHRHIYDALYLKDPALCKSAMQSHLEFSPYTYAKNYFVLIEHFETMKK